jgi:hypothetical protein
MLRKSRFGGVTAPPLNEALGRRAASLGLASGTANPKLGSLLSTRGAFGLAGFAGELLGSGAKVPGIIGEFEVPEGLGMLNSGASKSGIAGLSGEDFPLDEGAAGAKLGTGVEMN